MSDEQEKFNLHCAKVMGYHGNTLTGGTFYFGEEEGEMICPVDKYDPYNNIEQIEPVIDSLLSAIGLHLNTGLAQRSGILVASRALIIEMMPPAEESMNVVEAIRAENKDNIRKKLFNAYCAKTMGWHRGTGCYKHEYYKLEICALYGSFAGMVDEYNPYDKPSQSRPVLDKLGLHVSRSDEVTKGPVQACRDLILGAMASDEDSSDEDSEWGDNGDLSNMMWDNLMARNTEDSDDEISTVPNDLLDVEEGWDEHDKLFSEMLDSHPMYERVYEREPVPPITNFAYGITAEHEDNCANFGFDFYDTPTPYPNVFVEREEFNQRCRDIMNAHSQAQGGSLLLPANYNPYYDMQQLSLVMEIVLGKTGMTFAVNGDWTACMMVEMRRYVTRQGADVYALSEEEQFNVMCRKLCEGYNIMPTDTNYNPWDSIEDLAPIMPIIIDHTPDHPFKIPGVLHDNAIPAEERHNMDLLDNMRFYVQCYGKDVLGELDE